MITGPTKPPTADETGHSVITEDLHYQDFLAEQQKREAKWSANREASKATKAKAVVPVADNDTQAADEVGIIKQKLEAKNRECTLLMNQLLGQESLCKVSTKSVTLFNKYRGFLKGPIKRSQHVYFVLETRRLHTTKTSKVPHFLRDRAGERDSTLFYVVLYFNLTFFFPGR